MIGGHVQMMFDAITTMAPNAAAGQVRALGTTGTKRSALTPDVPTVAEAGVPGYEATIWLGVMAPAGTPKAVVDKLNAEIDKVIARPDVKEAWAKQGAVPMVDDAGRVRQVPARRHREMGQGGEGFRHQGELTGAPANPHATRRCGVRLPISPLGQSWRRFRLADGARCAILAPDWWGGLMRMSLDWLPGLDLATGTFTLPLWAVGVAAALFVALIVIAVVRVGADRIRLAGLPRRRHRDRGRVRLDLRHPHRRARPGRRAPRARSARRRSGRPRGRAGLGHRLPRSDQHRDRRGRLRARRVREPRNGRGGDRLYRRRGSRCSPMRTNSPRGATRATNSQIAGLRRTVAADRYGLASQVLATRDGCTADACDAFGLVYDDKKLRANMRDRLFDVTVARYAVNWPTRTRPLASSGSGSSGRSRCRDRTCTFPSAPSIPPVSIMNCRAAGSRRRPAAAADRRRPTARRRPIRRRLPRRSRATAAAAAKNAARSAPLSLNPAPKQ